MSKTLYSLEVLQDDLQQFIYTIGGFNAPYCSIYRNLFNLGFRIGEITQPARWNMTENPLIIIDTEKNSNNRIINISEFDEYAQAYLIQNLFPYQYTSEKMASYFMKNYYPRNAMYIGDKLATTHLFRHYAIKFWYEIGWTVQEISDFIGEVDNKNTIGYIDSELFYS